MNPPAPFLEEVLHQLHLASLSLPSPSPRPKFIDLGLGLLCGQGPKTITSALEWLDQDQQDWSADYRLFSQTQWLVEDLFAPLFAQAVASLLIQPAGPQHPWRALPVSFSHALTPKIPKRGSEQEQTAVREFRKKHRLSVIALEQLHVCRRQLDLQPGGAQKWLIDAVDGSYANRTFLRGLPERTDAVARVRKDAKFRAYLPPEQREGAQVNFRDEKTLVGVGQAQVRSPQAVARAPAFLVACYALLLWSNLVVFGDHRTAAFEKLPRWRNAQPVRPSTRDLLRLLQQQAQDYQPRQAWIILN
jgi:hypothetical protein